MKRCLFIPLLFLCPVARAQEDSASHTDLLETIAESFSGEEFMAEDPSHPEKISLSSPRLPRQLLHARLIRISQARALEEHIRKNGRLISILEMQAIPGFDDSTLRRMMPFLSPPTDRLPHPQTLFRDGNHFLTLRVQETLEDQPGYTRKIYAGSPVKFYTGYRFHFKNQVRLGFTGEKDAGEPFLLTPGRQGFDFSSAHLFVQNTGKVKSFILGDYGVQAGQGLLLWNGFAFGKSAGIMNVQRYASGIFPHTSTDENRFFRGTGVTLQWSKTELTLFGSLKKTDGNISPDSSLLFSAFQETGLHRTAAEIRDRKSIEELAGGGRMSYAGAAGTAGINFIASRFSKEMIKPGGLYRLYSFSGRDYFAWSADGQLSIRNFSIFGEAALYHSRAPAFLLGMLAGLSRQLSLSLLYRNYHKGYVSLYGRGFGETYQTSNENGIWAGLQGQFGRSLSASAYIDLFRAPWLRYLSDAPSHGNDALLQLNWNPAKTAELYLRFRSRLKQQNTEAGSSRSTYLKNIRQNHLRIHLSTAPADRLVFRARAEWSAYGQLTSSGEPDDETLQEGFLIYQDIGWQDKRRKLSFTLRYALFETDTYQSRIYAYEYDPAGGFSIPAYYYHGSRIYLLSRLNLSKRSRLWIKAGRYLYPNRETIGSGYDEIEGSQKTEVKVQFRLEW